jgi:hypothetical protein
MKVGEVGGGEEGWVDEAMVCCLYPNQTILQERHNRSPNPSKAEYCKNCDDGMPVASLIEYCN